METPETTATPQTGQSLISTSSLVTNADSLNPALTAVVAGVPVPRSDYELAQVATDQDPRGAESVLSFFLLESLGDAMVASGWTVEQEIRHLVEIAVNEALDPKVRIVAMDAIRRRQLEALKFNGMLQSTLLSQTVDSDGTLRAQAVASELRLASSVASQSQRYLSNIMEKFNVPQPQLPGRERDDGQSGPVIECVPEQPAGSPSPDGHGGSGPQGSDGPSPEVPGLREGDPADAGV